MVRKIKADKIFEAGDKIDESGTYKRVKVSRERSRGMVYNRGPMGQGSQFPQNHAGIQTVLVTDRGRVF